MSPPLHSSAWGLCLISLKSQFLNPNRWPRRAERPYRPHAVDGTGEAVVGNGGISCFDGPHGFTVKATKKIIFCRHIFSSTQAACLVRKWAQGALTGIQMQQTSRKTMNNQEQKRNLLHRNQELQKRVRLGEGAPLRGPQHVPPGQWGTQHSRALWEEGPCGIPRVPQGKLEARKTLMEPQCHVMHQHVSRKVQFTKCHCWNDKPAKSKCQSFP